MSDFVSKAWQALDWAPFWTRFGGLYLVVIAVALWGAPSLIKASGILLSKSAHAVAALSTYIEYRSRPLDVPSRRTQVPRSSGSVMVRSTWLLRLNATERGREKCGIRAYG